MSVTGVLASLFRRSGMWEYLTTRAKLKSLKEREELRNSHALALLERLPPGAVVREGGDPCYLEVWMPKQQCFRSYGSRSRKCCHPHPTPSSRIPHCRIK